MFSPKSILIIGGGRGLGLGLTQKALERYPNGTVFSTFRSEERAQDLLKTGARSIKLDPLNEIEVEAFCDQVEKFDLVINCVGFLHDDQTRPEKSLRDINVEDLQKNFLINSVVTPIWAKYLRSKFSKEEPSVFATLSAMVGSIGENQIGGWYGYRASKAALNMFIKNISIEYERSRLKTSVVAIHPGTTHTDLSRPFSAGVKHTIWEPVDAATNILSVLESCPLEGTGLFKNWDGRKIEW